MARRLYGVRLRRGTNLSGVSAQPAPTSWPGIARQLGPGLILSAIIVGSGIAATNLTTDAALRLLINSLVTAMGLAVLIAVFLPVGDRKSVV